MYYGYLTTHIISLKKSVNCKNITWLGKGGHFVGNGDFQAFLLLIAARMIYCT